jgi:multidrug efflux pump subunit AcrB
MTLSELSIRRPVFAWMFMAALVIFGGISFMKMGISQLPDVDFPVVSINIRLEGAAPEIIETEIADLVEGAVMGIQGVRKVTSNSESSEATIVVEFELNRDIEQAMQDVQVKVAQIQQKLPRDVSPASITKANPEDQPIMYLSLQADKYPVKDLMTYVNDTIKDQFSMVAGVGDVTLGGFIAPNLRVWVSEKAMNKFSLSVSDIIAAIKNEHTELPAGQVEQGARQLFVRTMGEAESVSAFGNLTIIQRGGQPNYAPIPLKSVARVEEGLADTTRISRAMGVPGVGLAILKQRGSNAVAVAKGVLAKIIEIQKSLPSGMQLKINFDSTRFIEQAVSELNFTLVLSALLTALVCWLFLGSWTSTLNVLLSIPTSIIGTFIVLYFVGFTLNTFTLLGLSLSIGIVVDDAIMVLENIIRHQEKGEDRVTAAILGAKEITFAAFAATLAIVAIFLPVAFMSGVIGKFFFQFGVTITVAVLLSLVEALTLTPMRCSQFVEAGARKTRFGSLVEYILVTVTHFYAQTLRGALKFRWLVIIGALIFFSLSFSTLKLLNKEFIPVEDQSRFLIILKNTVGC